MKPTLIGRSSSHFTRVARMFAAELGVEHGFQVVRDLGSREPAAYGGNPALRIPSLSTSSGTWFGALNVCRALQRLSTHAARPVWPEDLLQPVAANAQELVLQTMSNGVTLITAGAGGVGADNPFLIKARESLEGSLVWLDRHLGEALAALPPEPRLSYLEVTLYCLVTHLDFRNVCPSAAYPALVAFCRDYGARPSAQQTPYRYDA